MYYARGLESYYIFIRSGSQSVFTVHLFFTLERKPRYNHHHNIYYTKHTFNVFKSVVGFCICFVKFSVSKPKIFPVVFSSSKCTLDPKGLSRKISRSTEVEFVCGESYFVIPLGPFYSHCFSTWNSHLVNSFECLLSKSESALVTKLFMRDTILCNADFFRKKST